MFNGFTWSFIIIASTVAYGDIGFAGSVIMFGLYLLEQRRWAQ